MASAEARAPQMGCTLGRELDRCRADQCHCFALGPSKRGVRFAHSFCWLLQAQQRETDQAGADGAAVDDTADAVAQLRIVDASPNEVHKEREASSQPHADSEVCATAASFEEHAPQSQGLTAGAATAHSHNDDEGSQDGRSAEQGADEQPDARQADVLLVTSDFAMQVGCAPLSRSLLLTCLPCSSGSVSHSRNGSALTQLIVVLVCAERGAADGAATRVARRQAHHVVAARRAALRRLPHRHQVDHQALLPRVRPRDAQQRDGHDWP